MCLFRIVFLWQLVYPYPTASHRHPSWDLHRLPGIIVVEDILSYFLAFSPISTTRRMASGIYRATSYPGSAADRRKEHHCHPSLRIWKLICNDCHRNRDCCYSAQDGCCYAAQIKKLSENGCHLPFAFQSLD